MGKIFLLLFYIQFAYLAVFLDIRMTHPSVFGNLITLLLKIIEQLFIIFALTLIDFLNKGEHLLIAGTATGKFVNPNNP